MNFKKFFGKMDMSQVMLILVIVGVLAYAVMKYSSVKGLLLDGMKTEGGPTAGEAELAETAEVKGASEETDVQPADATGLTTTKHGNDSAATAGAPGYVDPSELLPKNMDTEFGASAMVSNNDLSEINLLSAGHHAGINTVGSSLRNPNLQLRSEPANPRAAVGPFLNSTIEPDMYRRPLEIGSTE